MKKIMLVCEMGFSTSMMEVALKKEIEKQGLDAEVEAFGIPSLASEIANHDYILLGPQISFRENEFKKKYPEKADVMSTINPADFAFLNAKKILETVMKVLNEKEN